MNNLRAHAVVGNQETSAPARSKADQAIGELRTGVGYWFTCRFTHQLVLASLVLATTLAIAGCQPNRPIAMKSTPAASTAVRTVAVATTTLQRKTTQPASLHAYFQTPLHAQATGYVSDLKVDIGDVVDKDAVLAIIEVPELRKKREVAAARITRLEAEERRAQAGIDLAAAEVLATEAKLAVAKSLFSGADAAVSASQAEFNRTNDLVNRQSLQSRMLDESRKRLDTATADRQAMQASIASAEADVAVANSKRVAAEANKQAAQAETESARRELEELDVLIDFATIKAPFAGVITERNVDPGNLVGSPSDIAGKKPLFVISQVNRVRVRIPVPETEAPLVKVGDEVTLTFPSFANEPPLTTPLVRCSGMLDPSTRTMIVEAELDNVEGKLLPGMFGQATIDLSTKVAAHSLPAQAIRFDETGNAYVYVVSPDETVSVAPVSTGNDDGITIEVLSGVQAGERVIGPHLSRFSEGQKVTVLPN